MMADEPKRRSLLRTVLVSLLQVVCVGYVGYALYQDRHELTRALDLSASAIALLVALMLLAHVQRTLEFTYMLRRLGVKEPFWDGFWLTAAGYLLNHLPFNAGFLMRAQLLKQDHSLPYTQYVSLTMVNALVNVGVGALFGIVAALRGMSGGGLQVLPLLGFSGIVGASLALIWLPRSLVPKGSGFFARHLGKLVEGIALIRGNGLGIVLLAGLALTRIVGVAVRLWICFDALGNHISALGAMLLGWATVLFTLVNVTPGNLGLRELALSLASAELGSTQSVGMAAASMDRVVLLAVVVATGLPGLYSLRHRGRAARGSA